MNGLIGLAAAVCALAVGCGSGEIIATGEGDAGYYVRAEAGVSAPPGSGSTGGGGGLVESGTGSGSSGGATASSGGATTGSGGGSGSSSGGPAGPVCAPGIACGGLADCDDHCFTEKCCVLVCQCTDSSGQTGTLSCVMNC